MSSATSSAATSVHRNTAAASRASTTAQRKTEEPRALVMGTEEAAVLKVDLSDLSLPQVGGLQVDGFKPSFFERLFGKR
jgi:hypothetical protein